MSIKVYRTSEDGLWLRLWELEGPSPRSWVDVGTTYYKESFFLDITRPLIISYLRVIFQEEASALAPMSWQVLADMLEEEGLLVEAQSSRNIATLLVDK